MKIPYLPDGHIILVYLYLPLDKLLHLLKYVCQSTYLPLNNEKSKWKFSIISIFPYNIILDERYTDLFLLNGITK